MSRIRRILCPVDFSDYSMHAVAHAAALARSYDATLLVLHVWPLTPPPPPYEGLASTAMLMLPDQRKASLGRLNALVASLDRPSSTVEAILEEGTPATVILDVARAREADLLVVGTHGRGGFDRFVLGSVTEKLLHKSPCPVLTVPKDVAGEQLGRVSYARVLCALDDVSAPSASLDMARSLARESKAELILLHVVEPVPEPVLAEVGLADAGRETDATSKQWLQALDKLAATYGTESPPTRTRVVVGKAGVEIVRVAREEHADLIVMGVRGRGAVDLFLFGSTSNRVVRHAPCPVLTVGTRAAAQPTS